MLGGNPAMDWHLIQGGVHVAILLGMLHNKETGISSGMCAFTFTYGIYMYKGCEQKKCKTMQNIILKI